MIQTIQQYLQFPFVRYALVVGTLIALCTSLLGVTLVLKRFSFIGDGLSHVAFGAMAIAGVLRITNDMLFVMPVTVLCAILLLRTGRNARIKGDAAIAMISVGRASCYQQYRGKNSRLYHRDGDSGEDLPSWRIQDGRSFFQVGIHILEDAADQDIGKRCIVHAQYDDTWEEAYTPPGRHGYSKQRGQQSVGGTGHGIRVE